MRERSTTGFTPTTRLRPEGLMQKAVWNGVVLAESDAVQIVEGNAYFSPDSVHREYFEDSDTHTRCPWKGTASYYTGAVEGERNVDAAWYYPDSKDAAINLKDHVAFWRGVSVQG